MKLQNNSRRSFIQKTLMAAGGIMLAPNFISCKSDDDINFNIDPTNYALDFFTEGIASFDPTSSSVIIWTRYSGATHTITWEVATDAEFNTVIRNGEITTDASRDYTIAVQLTELDADQKLYYRFANTIDKTISAVGETITLPDNANSLKLAICSCSNYQAGLFNVYDAMANSDADIIVHLGDYLYEYAAGGYGSNDENAFLDRFHEPATEILSLDDYRTRYKQYRQDVSLQLAHQKKPFICVWDDHEIANDAYKNGAENHDDATEGSYEVRKAHALQAYSEFLPFSRLDENNNELIYRTFNLGNLVNLVMLDTRIIGRDEQLDIFDFFTATGFDAAAYQTAISDTSRSLLGTTQRDWLINQITSSSAKWQVLGQQVLMGKMYIPAEMLLAFGSSTFNETLTELVTIKVRMLNNDPTLTAEETARVTTVLPYNLDAWDGYPVEREIIYAALAYKKIITLAGDTHNAWSNTLFTEGNIDVGIELATSSVSSPGFEGFIGTDPEALAGFEYALTTLVDGLNYFDASKRGFLLTTYTQSEVTSEWIFVNTILSETYTTEVGHSITYA
ncbi:alkaline phosphatase D family protein [Neotamlana laminarinivorans]|uniref:Alkaline phosphatase D family protein n=1 Tax=Neotamlana laminarinivorans TaxID=2883124 RepID=A0A9X1L451_9FLAO|nr:alkaline phosphatase D family protein [Tamlana laminarinivorans]MCB4798927.1 alkaline phosphatase D family protein [Tamlana laminarinivorans]